MFFFVGWEGVGVCSYLLIGFWHRDNANASAGKKAFIVNRIGDAGFLVGLMLLFWTLGAEGVWTLEFSGFRENAALIPAGLATIVALCLFVGAVGKSAQIPLYVWLPDAMAGPTPVSALIHAATMVTAGVYMIGRMNFLYAMSPRGHERRGRGRSRDRTLRGDDRPSFRTTSRKFSPTPRSASSATCSWPWASAPGQPASSI